MGLAPRELPITERSVLGLCPLLERFGNNEIFIFSQVGVSSFVHIVNLSCAKMISLNIKLSAKYWSLKL